MNRNKTGKLQVTRNNRDAFLETEGKIYYMKEDI